jgi:hypothetical protein
MWGQSGPKRLENSKLQLGFLFWVKIKMVIRAKIPGKIK